MRVRKKYDAGWQCAQLGNPPAVDGEAVFGFSLQNVQNCASEILKLWQVSDQREPQKFSGAFVYILVNLECTWISIS